PMGLGRPRVAVSRLRVKVPKLNIVPLSGNEVARFWSSFHTARDLAIVGLMLMHGLRSAEVLALNPDNVLLSEAQLRVNGKGNKLRFLPLAPETTQLIDHYLRLERPNPCSPALFVVLKGPARGTRMTPAGLRSLFRYHRRTTGIQLANPHRFRHTFASDMVRAGMSLPALMHLMGHADIETTLRYVQVTPQDVYLQYARAVAQCIRPLPRISTRIVPHQLRHTFATEMLRAGVSFPVLMKLLGHTDPEMTMRYVDVALTDLQREFHQARAHPKYLVPQPKTSSIPLRAGLDGVIDSLLAAQHVLEMFRRTLPKCASRSCLDRLSNRLTKILTEARKLRTT
ncbi:MAG: tyrosine-type recombinase/integrase, partial [Candidatus Sulfotelmatobacter sp.]